MRISGFLPEHPTLDLRESSRCTLFTQTLALVSGRTECFILYKKYIVDIKTLLLARFCFLIPAFVFK